MLKRRFVSRCMSYNLGLGAGKYITIDNRRGYETDSETEIAAIRGHKDFGNFIYETPTKVALRASAKQSAKELLKGMIDKDEIIYITPQPVQPLCAVNVEAERVQIEVEEAECKATEEAAAAEVEAAAKPAKKTAAPKKAAAEKK